MSTRSIWSGGVILLLAALVAGCASQEDKLVKEQIATLNKLSAAYESVVDNQSYEAAKPNIASLRKQLGEADKKLTELGPQRKEAALKKHAAEFEQATKHLARVRKKSAETAFGAKPSK